jgi:hypothetical protein
MSVLPKGDTVGIVLGNQRKIAPSRLGGRLAFTLAPHLQLINYRGRFSPFRGS